MSIFSTSRGSRKASRFVSPVTDSLATEAVLPARRPFAARLRRWKRWLAYSLLAVLCVTASGLGYGLWLVHRLSQHLPSVAGIADIRWNPATTLVSSDGVTLATFRAQDRRPVSLSEISPILVDATLATEDSRFYEHGGVDPRGVMRALWSNLRGGNARGQGASTLTQQLARNLYLTSDKTFTRKISEMLLARKIEAAYSKHDILEAYLNTVYYGNGCYGVEAASRAYFGTSAGKLTLGQAALLAGLPQRPAAFSPLAHRSAAMKRRREVLARMVATGKITDAQRQQTLAEPLRILRPVPQDIAHWRAPYFVADVVKQLRTQYGPEFLFSGTRIVTTLNWKMQEQAEKTIRDGLHAQGNGPNTGALVSLDPRNGYVRALVGGPDFGKDQFDAVTQGIRQPGSAFKPIVYATAFDRQVASLITPMTDGPLSFPAIPDDYVVHNYDGGYRGRITLLDAICHSVNTIAVKVAQQTGPDVVARYAAQFGLATPLEPGLPLALGASGVHPLELCSAYTLFANGCERYQPVFFTRITDARGQDVFTDDPTARRASPFLHEKTVPQINVALREVVLHGTARGAAFIPDAHGKTGTTSSHRDAWFVGYNRDLVTAIWVAHSVRQPDPDEQGAFLNRYLPMPGATGGQLCVPLWRQFMAEAAPLQARVNAAHGISLAKVAAPATETLLAQLTAEQQARVAQAKAHKAAQQSGADGDTYAVTPASEQQALYGGPPLKVTAPDNGGAATQDEYETRPTENASGGEEIGDAKSEPDPSNGKPEQAATPNDAARPPL